MAEQLRLLSGATALQDQSIASSNEAKQWAQTFAAFQQGTQAAAVVGGALSQAEDTSSKEQNMVDAHVAKADAFVFNQKTSNSNGTERRLAYEQTIADVTDAFKNGKVSTGYYQGYLSGVEGKYDVALQDQQKEYNNSVGVAAGSEYLSALDSGLGGDATVYTNNKAEETGVPRNIIRDGVLNGVYDTYNTRFSEATTPEELSALEKKFGAIKSESFDSTQLLKTRSAELSARIKQLESSVTNTIATKRKQFKYEAGIRISDAIGSSENPLEQYNKTPEAVAKDLSTLHSDNPRELLIATNNYRDSYKEHDEARIFTASNTVYSPIDIGKVKSNSTLKDYWEKSVSDSFVFTYMNNDMNNSVAIANSQGAFLGEVGNTFYSTFQSTNDPIMLKEFIDADKKFRTTQGGRAAYNNLYSKEQGTTILMTSIAMDSIGFSDPTKAREMVYRAQAAPAKPTLPVQMKKMQDKRRDQLGSAYQDYRSDLNILNNLEGADIQAAEKKLYEYYSNRDIEKENFKVDTQYGNPKPSIDEKRHYQIVSELITEHGIDPDEVDLKVMPDGRVAVNDKTFDTPLFFLNSTVIEDKIESEITSKEPAGPLERKLRGAAEGTVSSLAAAQGAIVSSFRAPEVINTKDEQGNRITTINGKTGMEGLSQLVSSKSISIHFLQYCFEQSQLKSECRLTTSSFFKTI